jgi:hypothetical protein
VSWLDALLGQIYSGGVRIALSKGINFSNGLQAVLNQTTKVVDVSTVPSAPDAAVLAPLLRGTGLTVTSDRLVVRARPRLVAIQEWFVSGNTTSGSIGTLGWNLLGTGTPAYTRVNNNAGSLAGSGQIATSASANNRSTLLLGESETREVFVLNNLQILQFELGLVATATRRDFVGMQADYSQDPLAATDCLGFAYDSAVGPNWFAVARAAGLGTPINTGIAASTSRALFTLLQLTPGTVTFHAGDTLVHTASSGLPTVGMNVGFRVETLAAAAAQLRPGYFGVEIGLGGAHASDNFLEA